MALYRPERVIQQDFQDMAQEIIREIVEESDQP